MPQPPPTAILYPPSPSSHSAVILDIPLSLSLAQDLSPPSSSHVSASLRTILSTPAPTEPYPSTEPKSEKARQRVLERIGGGGGEDSGANELEAWIKREFEGLKTRYEGFWCGERWVAEEASGRDLGRKRKRKDGWEGDQGYDAEHREEEEKKRGGNEAEDQHRQVEELDLRRSSPNIYPSPEASDSPDDRPLIYPSVEALYNRRIRNPHDTFRPLILPAPHAAVHGHFPQASKYRYNIPPCSAFLLSTITPQSAKIFTDAVLELLPERSESAGPGQFDVIVLDPPWANRSVRRSKKYTIMDSYAGAQTQGVDPMASLEGMLGQHIAPQGLVACWITSKPAAKAVALSAFEQWGVHLIEEWVWLKVTTRGEPVTQLDGIWRKPYEVLLLGREGPADGKEGNEEVRKEVKKRLIVAVPDLHSRKPNLRELIEPMMPNPRAYRALEVFARNLTAGWWAWGDECLRYNGDGYWSSYDLESSQL